MTVMTTERPNAAAQQQAGSLAIRADQTMWSPEQAAVLRQSGISDDVTNAELAGFLHLCQRTGLDPFSRQIYLIGRKDRKAGRVVFTPQTGIDGYRVIAHRVTGQTGGTYGYEDTLWCDAAGRWRDVWLDEQPPAAAKVTVIRNGQRFSAVAAFREYAQTFADGNLIGLWAKMPAGQIAKCCEALALRKAFPHDLAGVYTAEEMAQADNPEPAPSFARQAPAQDQWEQATPAPVQQPAEAPFDATAEGDISGGRDWVNEATEAAAADEVRAIWREAKAAGAIPATLAAMGRIGAAKAASEKEARESAEQPRQQADPTSGMAGSGTTAAPATAPATASPTPDPLPGAPDDPKARGMAVVDMYAAGRDNSLTPGEVQQAFTARYGHAVDAATLAEVAEFTADLTAAAGAR